jgi:hypothetical protein
MLVRARTGRFDAVFAQHPDVRQHAGCFVVRVALKDDFGAGRRHADASVAGGESVVAIVERIWGRTERSGIEKDGTFAEENQGEFLVFSGGR